MPIAVVQQKAADTAFNGAAAVVTFDATPTPGNWLVFFFHSTSTVADAPPGGVSLAVEAFDNGRPTKCYIRKVQDGDGAAWSFASTNTTTATNEAHGYEISGLDATAPTDKAVVGPDEGSVTSTQPGTSGTLAQAAEIVFVCAGLGGTSGGSESITSPTMTPDGAANHPRTVVGYTIVSATTALNPTIAWATARGATSVLVSFREGAAPSAFVPFRLVVAGTDTELECYSL